MSFQTSTRSLGPVLLAAGLGALVVTAALPLRSRGQQDGATRSSASDGSRLPRPDPPFGGVAGRTLSGSKPGTRPVAAPKVRRTCCWFSWTMPASATPRRSAAHARRRRLGASQRDCTTTGSTSRRSARRPVPHCCRAGTTTPSASARSRSFGRLAGLQRDLAKSAAGIGRSFRATGIRPQPSASGTSRPTTSKARRPVRPLAQRPGVRLLLGLPRRRVRPIRHGLTENNTIVGVPKEGLLLPDRHGRPRSNGSATRKRSRPTSRSSCITPGASHSPHHVPKEWADRYKGKFDQGWDKLREETFARQKRSA